MDWIAVFRGFVSFVGASVFLFVAVQIWKAVREGGRAAPDETAPASPGEDKHDLHARFKVVARATGRIQAAGFLATFAGVFAILLLPVSGETRAKAWIVFCVGVLVPLVALGLYRARSAIRRYERRFN